MKPDPSYDPSRAEAESRAPAHRINLFEPQPVIERVEIENRDGRMESIYGCVTCGAAVHAADIETHLSWHDKRDEPVVVR